MESSYEVGDGTQKWDDNDFLLHMHTITPWFFFNQNLTVKLFVYRRNCYTWWDRLGICHQFCCRGLWHNFPANERHRTRDNADLQNRQTAVCCDGVRRSGPFSYQLCIDTSRWQNGTVIYAIIPVHNCNARMIGTHWVGRKDGKMCRSWSWLTYWAQRDLCFIMENPIFPCPAWPKSLSVLFYDRGSVFFLPFTLCLAAHDVVILTPSQPS